VISPIPARGAYVREQANGVLAVGGVLTFDTVPDVYAASVDWLGDATGPVTIDLAEVQKADSAGLALLIEWLQRAGAAGRELRFSNVPLQVRSLTRVSGLSEVLAF
jgi:phospholipid transport system transporter-binding protein